MLRSKTDIRNLGIPVALEDSKKAFSAACSPGLQVSRIRLRECLNLIVALKFYSWAAV